MQKDIFTLDQEDQIRKAFNKLDDDLGLNKLDDDRDINRIFNKLHQPKLNESWINNRLQFLEEKIAELTKAIDKFISNNALDKIGDKFSLDDVNLSYDFQPKFMKANKISSDVTTKSYDIELRLDELVHSINKMQGESNRVTEELVLKLSYEIELKLNELSQAIDRQEKLLKVTEDMVVKITESSLEKINIPVSEISSRVSLNDKKPISRRRKFSFFGELLASPSYAFASIILVVSFGLVIGVQASKLSELKSIEDPYRGSKEIFQIVDNPEVASQSLLKILISEEIPYQMEFESKNKIKIKIPVNQKTMSLMRSRRIELPQETYCILIFEKAK